MYSFYDVEACSGYSLFFIGAFIMEMQNSGNPSSKIFVCFLFPCVFAYSITFIYMYIVNLSCIPCNKVNLVVEYDSF